MSEDLNKDIKELQEDMKEFNEYPVKLSWKNTWIVLTVIVSVIGSSFGLGFKVQNSYMTIELNKQARKYEVLITEKDDKLIETKRELKESKEEMIYLSNRYDSMKDKLQKCLDGCNYIFKDKENIN